MLSDFQEKHATQQSTLHLKNAKSLAKNASSQRILEGDIKSCFDKISHLWLADNIIMDKNNGNKINLQDVGQEKLLLPIF